MKRRRKYLMVTMPNGNRVRVVRWRGARGHVVRFTSTCSGCTDGNEGCALPQGSGCHECGFTGKRRRAEWVPLNGNEFEKAYGEHAR